MKSAVRHESAGSRSPFSYAKAPEKNRPIVFSLFVITLAGFFAYYGIIPWKKQYAAAPQAIKVQAAAEEALIAKTVLAALKVWAEAGPPSPNLLDETVRQMTNAVMSEIYWHQTSEKERAFLKAEKNLAKLGDLELLISPTWDRNFNIPAKYSKIEVEKIKAAAAKITYTRFKKGGVEESKLMAYVLNIVPDHTAAKKKKR